MYSIPGLLQDRDTAGQGAAGQEYSRTGGSGAGDLSAGLRLWLSNEHEGQELESLGIEVKL